MSAEEALQFSFVDPKPFWMFKVGDDSAKHCAFVKLRNDEELLPFWSEMWVFVRSDT